MKLFKYNNPETYADELAPLSKELCLLKNGNKYTVAIKNEVEIFSSGSYIPLDTETNLDYQRRYCNFVPIYPNYSVRTVFGIDKDYVLIQSYVRRLGVSQNNLFYFEDKIEISEDINYTIPFKELISKFIKSTYIAEYEKIQGIIDPNQESEQERVDAIYKP